MKDNYALQTEDDQNYGATRLSNPGTNTFDLMFDMWLQSSLIPGGNALDLTEAVYNSNVPGETDEEGNPVLFKDKMKDSFVDMNRYINVDDPEAEQYFSISWADGMNSMIYNEENLNALYAAHPELGKEAGDIPNTTDELLAVCRALREDWDTAHTGKDDWMDGGFAFYQSKDDNYITRFSMYGGRSMKAWTALRISGTAFPSTCSPTSPTCPFSRRTGDAMKRWK